MKPKQYVIYKDGATNIQTGVTNGLCDYSHGLTVEQYLAEKGEGYSCILFDAALKKIDAINDNTLIGAWKEIDEERFMDMLECLPPEKWKQKGFGVEIFRMSEYYTDNITSHFVCYKPIGDKKRYFEAYRRTSTSYDSITIEILAMLTDDAGSNAEKGGI